MNTFNDERKVLLLLRYRVLHAQCSDDLVMVRLLYILLCLLGFTMSSPVSMVIHHATVGDRVQLNCTTRLPVAVDWTYARSSMEPKNVFSNGVLVNGYRSNYEMDRRDEFTYNLVIPGALLDDSGIYTCTEKGGVGDTLVQVNLIVRRKQPFQMKPKGIVYGVEGSALLIECVSGLEAPVDFSFYPDVASSDLEYAAIFSDNRLVNTFGGRVTVATGSGEGRYQLSLRNISSSMSGAFECVENGGLGPGSDRVEVLVGSGHVSTDATPSYRTPMNTTYGSPSDSGMDSRSHKSMSIVAISLISAGVVIIIIITAVLVTVLVKRTPKKPPHPNDEVNREQIERLNQAEQQGVNPDKEKSDTSTRESSHAIDGTALASSSDGATLLATKEVVDCVNEALATRR